MKTEQMKKTAHHIHHRKHRISQHMHYGMLAALIISNITTLGLALLFSHSLLGEGLGYFVFLGALRDLRSPHAVYATTQHVLKLSSTQFKTSWFEESLIVHPANANIIFRGTRGGGILKSSDAGRTWEFKNNGLPSLFIGDIEFDPSNSNTMYATVIGHLWSNGGVLVRSLDGGEYWEQVPGVVGGGTPFNVNPCANTEDIAIDPTDPSRLYIGVVINACNVRGKLCGGLYSSQDAGATFNLNPWCQGQTALNTYRSNDASIVKVHPTRTNEIFVASGWGAHPEQESIATSHDYGATVGYEDVVDTRNSFLPAAEQYVTNLFPQFFELAKSDPDIRYAVHGGDSLKRRSDGQVISLGCCGTGWDTDVGEIVVRYAGDRSQSSRDGVDDNDSDSDATPDNIWKPIFSIKDLPILHNPSSSYYTTTYTIQSLIVDPTDEDRIYITTFGWASDVSYPNYTATIWELTPSPDPSAAWQYRAVYQATYAYGQVTSIRTITIDPSNRFRIYFVEAPWAPAYLGITSSVARVKKIESSDQGVTWQATELATDYPYFHATDIQEFQTTDGPIILAGSTNGLWAYYGGSWSARSALDWAPQGLTFSTPVQSPLDPDILYVKGPRSVSQSFDGARTYSFQPMDEIDYNLGHYYSVTGPSQCSGEAYSDPIMPTSVINALAVHPSQPDLLFAGADNGLWKNANARRTNPFNLCETSNSIVNISRSWQKVATTGFGNAYIWSLVFDPSDAIGSTLWAGTRDGLYKSINGGSSWQIQLANVQDVKDIEFNSRVILVATLNGTYRSSDAGVNWTRVISYGTQRLSHRHGQTADWAAATNNGIWESQDNGSTWQSVAIAFSGQVDAVLYTTSPTGDERFYYSGDGKGLYQTDPLGVDTQAPTIPSNVTASATSATEVSLRWNASTDNIGVTGYNILRRESGGFLAKIGSSVTTTFSDSGLTNGQTYYYAVQAYDAEGNVSSNSSEVSIAVLDPNRDQVPPTTPTNLQAVVNGTTVALSWSPSTDNVGIYGYYIYQSTKSGGPYSLLDESATTSYVDSSRSVIGGTYFYIVKAIDETSNESGSSNEVSATVITVNQLAPANLTSKAASRTEVQLNWTAPSTAGTQFTITGYRVSRGPTNLLATVATTTYRVTGLAADTAYTFFLRSVESGGLLSKVATTTARTLIADPVCGNGIAEGLEECDGNDVRTVSCSTYRYSSGTVSCTLACELNIAACSMYVPCVESWNCADWTTCSGSSQSRTCTDQNNCGTTAQRPVLTQNCTAATSGGGGGGGGGGGSIPPPASNLPPVSSRTGTLPSSVPVTTQGTLTPVASGNTSISQQQIRTTVAASRSNLKTINKKLVNRLVGRILLQVQSVGEAWYLEPVGRVRFYLANGVEAYQALRKFGLGISNANIAKIPVGVERRFKEIDIDGDLLPDKMEEGLGTDPDNPDMDGDGFTDGDEVLNGFNPKGAGKMLIDLNFAKKFAGRVLIQVEEKGQAWYINPVDFKRYYLANGEAAYQIMRYLSLGIRDIDLNTIGIGDLK